MEKWTDNILKSSKRLAMPVMTHPGIELLGKTVREAVSDGKVHFEAMKVLAERYEAFACPAIMDLTVEAEAFGASVNVPEKEIPTVIGRLVSDADSVRKLCVPALTAGRIPAYIEANKLASAYFKDKIVLGSCIGPFSLAGRLYDMSEIMVAIYIEPDTIMELLDKCTELLMNYCRAQKEAGSAGVVMAEPAAGLLSDDDCMMFSTPYVKRIVDELQDDSFTIVLHNCGNTGHCTHAMIESGARALHFGNKIDMESALKEIPSDVIAMGNIDPVSVFRQGSVAEVKAATMNLLESTKQYHNFVISSGCDIPPHTPIENIDAFFETVKEFNDKR
jgi:uroporphyrinogen decarboxylase